VQLERAAAAACGVDRLLDLLGREVVVAALGEDLRHPAARVAPLRVAPVHGL
jgi:hypothetical protein